jgi:hypothetical protein
MPPVRCDFRWSRGGAPTHGPRRLSLKLVLSVMVLSGTLAPLLGATKQA